MGIGDVAGAGIASAGIGARISTGGAATGAAYIIEVLLLPAMVRVSEDAAFCTAYWCGRYWCSWC